MLLVIPYIIDYLPPRQITQCCPRYTLINLLIGTSNTAALKVLLARKCIEPQFWNDGRLAPLYNAIAMGLQEVV